MKVNIYSCCWNEQLCLPFYLRWYNEIADNIYLYDDGTTDDSLNLLKDYPKVTLRQVDRYKGDFTEVAHQRIKNHAWKEDDADWIIVCDIDEFLATSNQPDPKNVRDQLEKYLTEGITIPNIHGYQMSFDHFPKPEECRHLTDLVTHGQRSSQFDKQLVFNRSKVTITYQNGCHACQIQGQVTKSTDIMYLLHMRFLGIEETLTRTKERATRRDERDNCQTYFQHDDAIRREVMNVMQKSQQIYLT